MEVIDLHPAQFTLDKELPLPTWQKV